MIAGLLPGYHDNYSLTICLARANVSSENMETGTKSMEKASELTRHTLTNENTSISLKINNVTPAHPSIFSIFAAHKIERFAADRS